jgi:hypothetical protein
VAISAETGEGLAELRAAIGAALVASRPGADRLVASRHADG